MADIITIVSSVLKNDTYPKYVDITAPYGCGTVSILLDDSYTEQMRQELPNITINIYTEHDGERVLFTSRALSMPVNSTKLKFSTILKGIPNECIIAFIPEFDNNAFISHNNNAVVTGDEVWSAPITEFPITVVWNNANITVGGGGGGTPSDASKVKYNNATSGLNATNVQAAIDEVVDDLNDKLDKAPDGTTNLIDSSGVINPQYLPDYLLGQVVYGGNVTTGAVATLTTAAQHKLGITDATITLTNNTTDITGYEANEGIYYIATADFTFANISITSGDWLISTGTAWTKVDTTNEVTGVKGDSESVYRTGNVNITKDNIGLGNVDNTSDLDKPISTATQTALNGKIDTAGTGLSKSGTTLNHSNSVTANTTTSIKKFTYDAQGHITGSSEISQAQQNAIDSGITSTRVSELAGIAETGSNYVKLTNGDVLYISSTVPTGTIPDGAFGIGF